MPKKRPRTALVAAARTRQLRIPKASSLSRPFLKDSTSVLSLEDTIALTVPATVVRKGRFAVVEVMSTGRSAGTSEIFEIAALLVDQGETVREYSTLVRTTRELPAGTFQKSGIHDGMLTESGVSLQDALSELLSFVGDEFLFAYDGPATQDLLAHAASQYRLPFKNHFGCTKDLARVAWPGLSSYAFVTLTRHLKLPPVSDRAAMDKAIASLRILDLATKTLTGPDGRLSKSLNHWAQSPETLKLLPTAW